MVLNYPRDYLMYNAGVDENEQPQDLSMKTLQRAMQNSDRTKFPTFLPPQPIKQEYKRFSPYLLHNKVPVIQQNIKQQRPLLEKEKFPGNLLLGAEGLRLISEVASIVHTNINTKPVTGHRVESYHEIKRPYAYDELKTPVRVVLKERSPWAFHPYMNQLSPYQHNQKSYNTQTLNLPRTPVQDEAIRPRSGSTSPPGEYTETSGSDGSPENNVHRLSCEDCGRSYATMAGLTRHKQFNCPKDMNSTYSCKYCSKIYTSVGALKMHIRTHTLPCKCHICGKAFSRPWLLQGHIRTHTGEKPFECPQCQRSFADRSNLRAHLQTHAQVKKYACRTCPKTFSRMSLLIKHQNHGCPATSPNAASYTSISPSIC